MKTKLKRTDSGWTRPLLQYQLLWHCQ